MVEELQGTIVECNTAYAGRRNTTGEHWKAIAEHGFLDIAPCDIMDEDGELSIPVNGGKHLTENFVGAHLQRYDSMLLLSHFKGHAMGGFGGADKAVMDYLGRENLLYINVANRLSVDCDCDSHPKEPEMADLGIFASVDPVALDQACVDAVYRSPDPGKAALIERMESRNGIHTVETAAALGLGSRDYELICL